MFVGIRIYFDACSYTSCGDLVSNGFVCPIGVCYCWNGAAGILQDNGISRIWKLVKALKCPIDQFMSFARVFRGSWGISNLLTVSTALINYLIMGCEISLTLRKQTSNSLWWMGLVAVNAAPHNRSWDLLFLVGIWKWQQVFSPN